MWFYVCEKILDFIFVCYLLYFYEFCGCFLGSVFSCLCCGRFKWLVDCLFVFKGYYCCRCVFIGVCVGES